MKRFAHAALVLTLLVSVVAGPAAASSHGEPNAALKVLDLAFVRPISLAVSFASTGLFFGTLPITTLTGVGEESTYVLLMAPWRYTAARDAGHFGTYRDGLNIFGTQSK